MLHIQGLEVSRSGFCIALPKLRLAPGEVRAVVGESGCGKSTLLELIGLILKPRLLQTFLLGGQDISGIIRGGQQQWLSAIRAQHLGFVLQSGALLPFLNVRQNIELPRRLLGLAPATELTQEAIGLLKLGNLLHKRPCELSIGERQRVAFVRAIAHQPKLLLADEPTAALDPLQSRALFELIAQLAQRLQIATLLVSHDWALVGRCGLATLRGEPCDKGTVFVYE